MYCAVSQYADCVGNCLYVHVVHNRCGFVLCNLVGAYIGISMFSAYV